MTDHAHNRVREAVYEIVSTAPLAPTIDDLDGRRFQRPRRSPLLIPAIVVLVVAAAVGLTSRLNESTGGNGTTVELTTSTPVTSELSTTDVFRIVRQSQAAVGNMDTLAGPLIQRCMAAKGFTFTPNSTVLMSVQDQDAFLLQRYPEPRQLDGIWGYVFETPASSPDAVEPDNSGPPGRETDYREALTGNTVASGEVRDLDGKVVTSSQVGDGCYGQSMAAIFGSQQAFIDFFTKLQTLEMLTGSSYYSLRTSPDFLARSQPWSQCMKKAGFSYRTVFDPWNQDWPSPRPTETEQRAAQADSTCRQGKGLDGANLNMLEGALLSEVLSQHPIGDYTGFAAQIQDLLAGIAPAR
jgi:hypothetical protein